jgi:hypothetical protein
MNSHNYARLGKKKCMDTVEKVDPVKIKNSSRIFAGLGIYRVPQKKQGLWNSLYFAL